MLAVPAPFPNPGSTGYLRDTAEPLRVIQHNADGTVLVARQLPEGGREARLAFHLRGATRNLTLPREDLCESQHDAVFCRVQRKLPRQRRTRNRAK